MFAWLAFYFISLIALLSVLTTLREPFAAMVRSDMDKSESYYLDRLTFGYDKDKNFGFFSNSGEFIQNASGYDAKKKLKVVQFDPM